MSTDAPHEVPTSPDEPRLYHASSTPPPQSTDLGAFTPIPGVHFPLVLGPPSPPLPPGPHPPPPPRADSPLPTFDPPVEFELLKAMCIEGRLRDVNQAIAQYLLANEPNPLTGQPDLEIFQQALAQAILHKHPAVVSYLFFMRVGKPSEFIHSARAARSIEIFKVFLEYGWNINQQLDALSPPILGHVCDDKALAEWLIKNGADVNARCMLDFTCLSQAVNSASLDTITMFFDLGHGDIHKGQLLHNAVCSSRPEPEAVELVNLLLNKGASVNEIQYRKDAFSWAMKSPFGAGTPLHYAVKRNMIHMVSCLLENGADITMLDSRGKSVMDLAPKEDGEAMIQLLQKHIPK